jgi:hypothetical protein
MGLSSGAMHASKLVTADCWFFVLPLDGAKWNKKRALAVYIYFNVNSLYREIICSGTTT